ncbi:cytidine deaminase [Fusarium heterosporum]|uniref:Cytidine deaminase n=1 Tax=Fusarium heterosporum TaxID=42747 RepID=A0A8H5WT12_FUSHE|nr:cytidine deaminase [Fusarium heterosporum]
METPETISKDDTARTAEVCEAHGITQKEFSELRQRATAAKATAYCPYSQFRVGATVLSSEGELTSGANVENASYPVGTCAERVTLGTAVTSGHRGFRAIAVATDIAPPASPCGMCRQFIREFCALDTPVIMFDKNEDFVIMKLRQLLPLSFGPDQLPPPGTLNIN